MSVPDSVGAMKSFNLDGDEWDETRDREGWRIKEAFVGQHVGGGLIGASMSEVQPGSKLWPYHAHQPTRNGSSCSAARRRYVRPKESTA